MVCLRANGSWIGMITLGLRSGDNFHWFVPVRHIRQWATEIGAEWLLDPSAKAPTQEQIGAIPLEVHRAGFGKKAPAPAPKGASVPQIGTMLGTAP
jgi:hypothetical protein